MFLTFFGADMEVWPRLKQLDTTWLEHGSSWYSSGITPTNIVSNISEVARKIWTQRILKEVIK